MKCLAPEVTEKGKRAECITEEKAQAELEGIRETFNQEYLESLYRFLDDWGLGGGSVKLAIPTDPVTRPVVRGIYHKQDWKPDSEGRPVYEYREAGKAHLFLSFYHPPETEDVAAALWEHVRRLSGDLPMRAGLRPLSSEPLPRL